MRNRSIGLRDWRSVSGWVIVILLYFLFAADFFGILVGMGIVLGMRVSVNGTKIFTIIVLFPSLNKIKGTLRTW